VLNEEVVPAESVSLLLTDPMYGREHLPQWADLAQFASRVLKPGSLLVAYSGQTYLPEVLSALDEHLTYVWVAGVRYSYPNNIFPLRIKNSLKLLLLFSKGAYDPGPSQFWLHDLIDGDGYPETKKESELQQGCREAEYLIETLTHPGDLVVDPFAGTGTVPVAAKRTGRRFIGAEISKERYDMAASRVAQDGEGRESKANCFRPER
jgi:site-specific DNA-methyltransferase (adenine-specific)